MQNDTGDIFRHRVISGSKVATLLDKISKKESFTGHKNTGVLDGLRLEAFAGKTRINSLELVGVELDKDKLKLFMEGNSQRFYSNRVNTA